MKSGEPRRRVLIADDDPDTAVSLSLLFQLEGFSPKVCTSSSDVLTTALDFLPELVMLDLDFHAQPSGIELVGLLRQQPSLRHTVIAAVTGWGRETDRAAAMAAGFQHFFIKPVDPEKLIQLAGSIERRSNHENPWPQALERRRQDDMAEQPSTERSNEYRLDRTGS
jgi:DNA-binding response OmpR family regulator